MFNAFAGLGSLGGVYAVRRLNIRCGVADF